MTYAKVYFLSAGHVFCHAISPANPAAAIEDSTPSQNMSGQCQDIAYLVGDVPQDRGTMTSLVLETELKTLHYLTEHPFDGKPLEGRFQKDKVWSYRV
jgi:hypothetical protein